MAQAGKILISGILMMLCACSTKYDEVAPDTELIVEVKDDNGQLLDGADVFVYSDSAAFNETLSTGNPAGYLSTAKTTSGSAHLTGLGPNVIYSIYVSYHDTNLFPGTYITLDNTDENFVLKNTLVQGSVSNLSITLTPADGFVTFWTQNSNATSLPIELFLGPNPGGSLNSIASVPPAPFEPEGVTVRVRKGNVSLEGKSAAGCLWADQVSVTAAQNIDYLLTDCVVGTVGFYTDATNNAKLPITLKLNANDNIANLSAAIATTPTDCAAVNLSVAYRVPGSYTTKPYPQAEVVFGRELLT